MNWELLQRELAAASSFQLEQVRTAVALMLEDPARVARVRQKLRPGLVVRYWDFTTRTEIEAEVIELKRSLVLVKHVNDGKFWNIPMTTVNVEEERLVPQPPAAPSQAHAWRIGDSVCFRDRQNREIFGHIVKLNPKRAKVRASEGMWNVWYEHLIQVLDAEATVKPSTRMIEGNRQFDGHDAFVVADEN